MPIHWYKCTGSTHLTNTDSIRKSRNKTRTSTTSDSHNQLSWKVRKASQGRPDRDKGAGKSQQKKHPHKRKHSVHGMKQEYSSQQNHVHIIHETKQICKRNQDKPLLPARLSNWEPHIWIRQRCPLIVHGYLHTCIHSIASLSNTKLWAKNWYTRVLQTLFTELVRQTFIWLNKDREWSKDFLKYKVL